MKRALNDTIITGIPWIVWFSTFSFVALVMKCCQIFLFFRQGFPPPLSTTSLSLKLRCVKELVSCTLWKIFNYESIGFFMLFTHLLTGFQKRKSWYSFHPQAWRGISRGTFSLSLIWTKSMSYSFHMVRFGMFKLDRKIFKSWCELIALFVRFCIKYCSVISGNWTCEYDEWLFHRIESLSLQGNIDVLTEISMSLHMRDPVSVLIS